MDEGQTYKAPAGVNTSRGLKRAWRIMWSDYTMIGKKIVLTKKMNTQNNMLEMFGLQALGGTK